MIIKFDHISYSCDIDNPAMEIVEGFSLDFSERELLNIDAKHAFLQKKAMYHDISLYRCEGKYPIEITAYPECGGHNKKYLVSDEVITVYSECPDETRQFYETLGFKSMEDDILGLQPFMESKKVILKIESADTGEVFLDKKGFGSLAFVVDRIEKHKMQLEKKNYPVTEIETLTVNGKALRICFVMNNVGDIVELIGIR